MPKTKFQGFIFGIIMSYAMAYGMEIYNIAIKEGFSLTIGGIVAQLSRQKSKIFIMN